MENREEHFQVTEKSTESTNINERNLTDKSRILTCAIEV